MSTRSSTRCFEVPCRAKKPVARGGAPTRFVGLVQAYDPAGGTRAPIMSEEERQVFVEAFRRSGFTGGINWYRNITRN